MEELLDRPSPLHGALRLATYCDGEDSWQPGCGSCGACGGPIRKTERAPLGGSERVPSWFCRRECERWWRANHQWQEARRACIKRDRHRCVKCHRRETSAAARRRVSLGIRGERTGTPHVALEVNHKTPLDGRRDGYATGCQHHLAGLETLCTGCHAEITAEQGRDRRERAESAERQEIGARPR